MQITTPSDTSEVTPSDKQTLVMFVHGFPVDHRMWEDCIEHLKALASQAELPLQLLAVDMPGSGDKSIESVSLWEEQGKSDDQALPWVVDYYVEKMREAGFDQAIWVGLSMGGYVVLDICQRYASCVQGLALLDTKASEDSSEARQKRMLVAQECLKERTVRPVLGFVDQGKYCSTQERERIQASFAKWINEQSPEGIAFRQRMAGARCSYESVLPTITVPTLVLCGDHDPSSPPADMERLAKQIPADLDFCVVPQCGHFSAVEHPDKVADALYKLILRVVEQHS